jgi:hypothetical protein
VTPSPQTTITHAVQAVITGLNLPGVASVVRRKHPLVSADDRLPIVIVSPEKETVAIETTEDETHINYPVRVTIAFAGNQLFEQDLDRLFNWKFTIRQALNKASLAGAPTVWDSVIDFDPPFNSSYFQADFDATALIVSFKSAETREV